MLSLESVTEQMTFNLMLCSQYWIYEFNDIGASEPSGSFINSHNRCFAVLHMITSVTMMLWERHEWEILATN